MIVEKMDIFEKNSCEWWLNFCLRYLGIVVILECKYKGIKIIVVRIKGIFDIYLYIEFIILVV